MYSICVSVSRDIADIHIFNIVVETFLQLYLYELFFHLWFYEGICEQKNFSPQKNNILSFKR